MGVDYNRWENFYFFIDSVFVREEYRKQGISKALIKHVDMLAKKLGVPEVFCAAQTAECTKFATETAKLQPHIVLMKKQIKW